MLIYREGAVCVVFYYKTTNHTASYDAVQYTITCGAMQLCHFASDFCAIFPICAVW